MTFNEALHPRGKGEHGGEWIKKASDSMEGKSSSKGVGHLPEAQTNAAWAKESNNWALYDKCEATRGSADKLTKLTHIENPTWKTKPSASSTKRAKMMLDLLAHGDTETHQVDNLTDNAAGRWSGIISRINSDDWRNPKKESVRDQMPSRRMTIPQDQMKAFQASLNGDVNISLASFAHIADQNMRDMLWGGNHGQEVFLRIDGNPRVLKTSNELVTGGQFEVVSHGMKSDKSYEVVLRQKGVFDSTGKLHPTEG